MTVVILSRYNVSPLVLCLCMRVSLTACKTGHSALLTNSKFLLHSQLKFSYSPLPHFSPPFLRRHSYSPSPSIRAYPPSFLVPSVYFPSPQSAGPLNPARGAVGALIGRLSE